MDLSFMLRSLDTNDLHEVVCVVAEVCAFHVFNKMYEFGGFNKPLFVASFAHTYESALKDLCKSASDEEIPF